MQPVAKERRRQPEADALLLIGDEALRFRHTNAQYPFEIDLGFEWWLWQHVPNIFAVWAVRKDLSASKRKPLEAALARTVAMNAGRLQAIAEAHASAFGMPSEELRAYLAAFHYRFGPDEEAGIRTFEALAVAHGLLGEGYGTHLLRGH